MSARGASSSSSSSAVRAIPTVADDDEDAPLLSDTEAAVACLLGECPPGALLLGSVPCALVHALYAVVHEATDVDRELERLRLSHTLRVLKLPAAGDERLLVRAEDYARALRDSGGEHARRWADVLPRCTGVSCHSRELATALGCTAAAQVSACEELGRAGFLVPAAQAVRAAPDEAPPAADTWLWGMPHAGRLLYALTSCRHAVLALLHKQKFHRALRQLVERAPAVNKALRHARLDLRYLLRDLIGKRFVKRTDTAAGAVLELTPAGLQAAAAREARRKRKR